MPQKDAREPQAGARTAPRKHGWLLGLPLAVMLVIVGVVTFGRAIGLRQRVNSNEGSAQSSSTTEQTPEQEFLEVAQQIEATDNDFHGRKQVRDLEAVLKQRELTSVDRCQANSQIAMEYLRVGDVAKAEASIEAAMSLARQQQLPTELVAQLHRARAIVFLRLAEQQNCVDRHCAQSCLFPIERGGVHQRRAAAEAARTSLLAYLETNPDDAESMVWLLNIIHMTLGTYPEEVPKQYLLEPAVFQSPEPFPRFIDIAPELGLNRQNLAGGVAIADFDGDNRLDILSSTVDPRGPLKLFHNQGDGTFSDIGREAKISGHLGGLHCEAVDYNNDGLMDLFVPRGAWFKADGRIRASLHKNNGDGTFSDVTRHAGLAEPAPSQVAVWGDFDNDGDLDLFRGYESLVEIPAFVGCDFPSQFFVNNGDGTFTDQTAKSGIDNDAWCKGGAAGDFDNDGDLDLFVSNYAAFDPKFGRDRLYRNNGNGTFVDVCAEMGIHEPARSFAAWFFDYDNDGWLDLFVASFGALGGKEVLAAR